MTAVDTYMKLSPKHIAYVFRYTLSLLGEEQLSLKFFGQANGRDVLNGHATAVPFGYLARGARTV